MAGSDDLEAIADLLADACVRTILRETLEAPRPAADLVAACDASRATVYRRLDDLADRGLLEERTEPDADGHHRTVYAAALDRLEVDLTAEGFEVTVTRRESAADRFTDFVEGLYD